MLEYMPEFAEFTRDEQYTVDAIVRRAVHLGIYDDPKDAEMDIAATHVHCPLDLAKLWSAPDSSFGHDMGGIQRYLDRTTGKLDPTFDPRCSAPAQPSYTLTRTELRQLLDDALGLFVEYRDTHGRDEEYAALAAASETIDGLDALPEIAAFEAELAAAPESAE